MNRSKRAKLEKAKMMVASALDIVKVVRYDEQEALDKVPVTFLKSPVGEKLTASINNLERATDSLEDVLDCINRAEV